MPTDRHDPQRRQEEETAAETFDRLYHEQVDALTPPPDVSRMRRPSSRIILRCPDCRTEFNVSGLSEQQRSHVLAEHRRRRHSPDDRNEELELSARSIIERASLQELSRLREERDLLMRRLSELQEHEQRRRLYEINPPIVVQVPEWPPRNAHQDIVPSERRECPACHRTFTELAAYREHLEAEIRTTQLSALRVGGDPPPCANCGKNHDDVCTVKPPEDRPRKIVL